MSAIYDSIAAEYIKNRSIGRAAFESENQGIDLTVRKLPISVIRFLTICWCRHWLVEPVEEFINHTKRSLKIIIK